MILTTKNHLETNSIIIFNFDKALLEFTLENRKSLLRAIENRRPIKEHVSGYNNVSIEVSDQIKGVLFEVNNEILFIKEQLATVKRDLKDTLKLYNES